MYDSYTAIDVIKQNKILLLRFNNPRKKNCMNITVYTEIGNVLREVADDPTVSVVVFTGVGDFFSAGNDLNPSDKFDDLDAYRRNSDIAFNAMITGLIECPQVVIALVNGPAIGIAVTMCALADIVWASETTYFSTPFSKLGIVPEACSSLLFPKIMGKSKAAEMLLFSAKMSAGEAYEYKFVSKIFKTSELESVIWPQIRQYADLPRGSLVATKKLLSLYERDQLYKALREERQQLNLRFDSEEFMNALMKFATRKSKL